MCTKEDTMISKKHRCSSPTKPEIKPKIRIIHIIAPEIIKTDVANFRELVQRLTGKPSENKTIKSNSGEGSTVREKIKGEDEIWEGANTGSGFLGGFGDLDGFMQEFSHQNNHGFAPVLPNLDTYTGHFG